jgi:hypothetical protein
VPPNVNASRINHRLCRLHNLWADAIACLATKESPANNTTPPSSETTL